MNGAVGTGGKLLVSMLSGTDIVGMTPAQFIHPAVDDSDGGSQIGSVLSFPQKLSFAEPYRRERRAARFCVGETRELLTHQTLRL